MITLPNPTLLDVAALAGAQAAHHLAVVLRSQWSAFWERDPATIAAELSADPAKTAAIFALNTQAAAAVNALLDAVGDYRFSTRAPDSLPTGWSFDGTAFVYIAPQTELDPEP